MKKKSTRVTVPSARTTAGNAGRDQATGVAETSPTASRDGWSPLHSNLLLTFSTIVCLAPFSGRAFHIDDTLFVRAAQQIAAHPIDPYGFDITWDLTRAPMSSVTQNPPLASYYIALVGRFAGWSERALHLAFILVAAALVLGTYRLARRFTRSPLLAALATLATPGVMVSAASVMCDTMMLALWIWAVIFWIEGLDSGKTWLLVVSGILTGASAFTKYFAISLIPLLLVYSIARMRRAGLYLLCLLIPVAMLVAYEFWTDSLYGHGLLQGAADFAQAQRAGSKSSLPAMFAVCLSFTGGCSLLGATFAPLVWPRKWIAAGLAAGGILSFALIANWLDTGLRVGTGIDHSQRWFIGVQLLLCIAAGMSVLALAFKDLLEKRNAESLFLALWVGGTFFFAAFVNYTVNARSVLPLIPAVAILVSRRFDRLPSFNKRVIVVVIASSAMMSFWITYGDSELANSARTAAQEIHNKTQATNEAVFFDGHWGFQYYMESLGAEPLDLNSPQARSGDTIVLAANSSYPAEIQPAFIASQERVDLPLRSSATTLASELGAGFYSSYWGPLPFAIGPVPAEHYSIIRLRSIPEQKEP